MPTNESIAQLLEPSLRQCQVELWGIHWQKGNKNQPGTLQLLIDKPGGVDLSDCQRVSNLVAPVLEAYDAIKDQYTLEVSSPGAERPIRNSAEWRKAVGSRVNITYVAGDSSVIVEGQLLTYDEQNCVVEVNDKKKPKQIEIEVPKIIAARLAVAF